MQSIAKRSLISLLFLFTGGLLWYSYVANSADRTYYAFYSVAKCSYLVNNKYYSFCGGTDPRLFMMNNNEDKLLLLAEKALEAELRKPWSSEERVRTYLNVIARNRPSTEIIRMRTTSGSPITT